MNYLCTCSIGSHWPTSARSCTMVTC